ncbi:MAG: hypothetical protein M3327_08210 [Actinomycetota bacterium]|nr:hypothetical protein [Actinomycetota bacterium]
MIPPRGRADVTLRLALLPSLFVPGNVYSLSIAVQGQEELWLDVVIWAEEDVEVAPAAPSPDAEPASEASETRRSVRCPACGRTFTRAGGDLRLRPHKTPDGAPCPERAGVSNAATGARDDGIVTALADPRRRKRRTPSDVRRAARRRGAAPS